MMMNNVFTLLSFGNVGVAPTPGFRKVIATVLRPLAIAAIVGAIVSCGEGVPSDQQSCAAGAAIGDPDNNPELLADCDTLLSVKTELAGEAALNWSVSIAIERWDGITVEEQSRDANWYLSERGLSGRIPSALGSLDGLESLVLWGNHLSGSIPVELAKLTNLRVLELGRNDLPVPFPASWAGLPN